MTNVQKTKADARKAELATKKAQDAENTTLEGDTADSVRKLVKVERKFSEAKHRIFVSTVIKKGGVSKLVPFRVPVDVEVELPVEIIAALKNRKIAKQSEGKQTLVAEFVVEVL